MSKIIRKYYEKAHTMPVLIEQKLKKFEKNPDIAKEFEKWITSKEYEKNTPISVEGYTAADIAKISPYLVGEGSFALLLELRENPERAKSRIASGFTMK